MTVCIIGCKKPYNPSIVKSSTNYLVVEGVINAGSDSTVIKLSRTVDVSSLVTKKPERDAIVTVESDQKSVYTLAETKPGYYVVSGLNLDVTIKYRLDIKTSNNQQYLSDFEKVKTTPPIDSVGFTVQSNDIQLYVNTHDPGNNTRYYRWDYNETWQFHSEFESYVVSDGQSLVQRTPSQMIYNCFGNNISSNIVLGSSAKLQQDVIYQNPVTMIASSSEKIETKYSILLRQYAITGEAYKFWVNLKKSTEQLGSIFDAEPTQINGNIHNVSNPEEQVVGYISACTVQTKRIFITKDQVPKSWKTVYPYTCVQDSNLSYASLVHPGSAIATNPFFHGPNPAGFLSAPVECVDCTLRGTTATPIFWK